MALQIGEEPVKARSSMLELQKTARVPDSQPGSNDYELESRGLLRCLPSAVRRGFGKTKRAAEQNLAVPRRLENALSSHMASTRAARNGRARAQWHVRSL